MSNVPNFNKPTITFPPGYPLHTLDEDGLRMHKEFKERLPSIFESLNGVPLKGEKEWADDACLVRYLKATHFKFEESVDRLQKTLQWRREYRPTEITSEEIEPEATTGKQFYTGFDKQGRPILFLVPAVQNTKTYERQLRFVVYCLEKGISLMPNGVDQFTLVIDYENMSMFNATPASVSKKFLEIVGGHYPERLGKAFM
ncbi:hypothetical protein HDU76_011005, partial [Blyttiomyces sp. JEL0837]